MSRIIPLVLVLPVRYYPLTLENILGSFFITVVVVKNVFVSLLNSFIRNKNYLLTYLCYLLTYIFHSRDIRVCIANFFLDILLPFSDRKHLEQM